MKSLDEQFTGVVAVFPDATLSPSGNGTYMVKIPNVALPEGWSKSATELRFTVPNGYPFASPDCFWADVDLRLATGLMPMNAAVAPNQPGLPTTPVLWFSWHLTTAWQPLQDELMTYVRVIRSRFKELR